MNNEDKKILPPDTHNTALKQQGLYDLNDDIFKENNAQLFDKEASEGLAQIPATNVPFIIEKLQTDLQKKLKKHKRKSSKIPSQQSVYFTIITILLLAIIAYVVIKKLH